jgi:hypothetical protein
MLMLLKRTYIILILFIILNLIIIIPTGNVNAQNLEITVDAVHKEVPSGKQAIFYWDVYNNNSVLSVEVQVDAAGDLTYFSQEHFTLKPGEIKKINQYCPTLQYDENGSNYTYTVVWFGTVTVGPFIEYSGPFSQVDLKVTAINENGSCQFDDNQHNINNPESLNNCWIVIGSLLFIGVIIISIWKVYFRKRKINLDR